jgi:GAF domain-containing protein
MLTWLRKILAPPVFEGDEDKTRTANALNTVLLTILAVALLSVFATPFVARALDIVIIIPPLVILASISLILMRSGRVRPAAWLFVFSFWVFVTVLISFSDGVNNVVASAYIVVVIGAGLLLGSRAALVFTGLSLVALSGMLYAGLNNLLPPHLFFTSLVGKFVWLAASLVVSGAYLALAIRNLAEALERARQSNRDLQAIQASLEERVEERTRDLAQHTHYLEATAAVAHDAASVLNLEELLRRVVSLISEQFGFYHTGIFLLDSTGEWAVLQAASSEGGKQMLARGHRLPVRGKSIVGYVTSRGEPRIALDVGADAVFFDNPDLPDTHSEAALPLRARGRAGREASGDVHSDIIGALDVQSTLPEAFSKEDVAALQTLADQVAMAISNAQLFRQAEEGLEAERRATAQMTEQAWKELFHVQRELSVVRSKRGLSTASDQQRPEIATARRTGKVTLDENTKSSLAAPVKVRDQVIGVIDAHKTKGVWTPEEIALVETLTEQMGVALEGARVYQDSQRRAAREQIVGQITSRMRATLDIDTVLETALNEIHRAMGLDEVTIHLATGETPIEPAGNGRA